MVQILIQLSYDKKTAVISGLNLVWVAPLCGHSYNRLALRQNVFNVFRINSTTSSRQNITAEHQNAYFNTFLCFSIIVIMKWLMDPVTGNKSYYLIFLIYKDMRWWYKGTRWNKHINITPEVVQMVIELFTCSFGSLLAAILFGWLFCLVFYCENSHVALKLITFAQLTQVAAYRRA